MILEIESIYGNVIIHGKHFNGNELRTIVKEMLTYVSESEFTSAFCLRYGFEAIPFSENIKVDYTIDLDTHMVIKPKY